MIPTLPPYHLAPPMEDPDDMEAEFGEEEDRKESTKIFMVEPKFVGLLIGKNGDTIRTCKKQSGCNIEIDQDVPPGSSNYIKLA